MWLKRERHGQRFVGPQVAQVVAVRGIGNFAGVGVKQQHGGQHLQFGRQSIVEPPAEASQDVAAAAPQSNKQRWPQWRRLRIDLGRRHVDDGRRGLQGIELRRSSRGGRLVADRRDARCT